MYYYNIVIVYFLGGKDTKSLNRMSEKSLQTP